MLNRKHLTADFTALILFLLQQPNVLEPVSNQSASQDHKLHSYMCTVKKTKKQLFCLLINLYSTVIPK